MYDNMKTLNRAAKCQLNCERNANIIQIRITSSFNGLKENYLDIAMMDNLQKIQNYSKKKNEQRKFKKWQQRKCI